MMKFSITNLLDQDQSQAWLLAHFHPTGLKYPRCCLPVSEAYEFRTTRKSQLTVYRCKGCRQTYNLYSGTVFEQRHLTPRQVVLLIRGVLKGEPATTLAQELELHYSTMLELRHDLQDNACLLQPTNPLPDERTETDEMFQNAGEKRGGTLQSG